MFGSLSSIRSFVIGSSIILSDSCPMTILVSLICCSCTVDLQSIQLSIQFSSLGLVNLLVSEYNLASSINLMDVHTGDPSTILLDAANKQSPKTYAQGDQAKLRRSLIPKRIRSEFGRTSRPSADLHDHGQIQVEDESKDTLPESGPGKVYFDFNPTRISSHGTRCQWDVDVLRIHRRE